MSIEELYADIRSELDDFDVNTLDASDILAVDKVVTNLKSVMEQIDRLKEPIMEKLAEVGLHAKLEVYVPGKDYDGTGQILVIPGSYYEQDGYEVGEWISSSETC